MRRTALLLVLLLLVGFAVAIPAAGAQGAEKVTICHKPGKPAEQTISIASAALPAHLRHGDYEGECGTSRLGIDACTAIGSGSLANLMFQGDEVVHVYLWFSDGGAHFVQPSVCDTGGNCATIPLWGSQGLFADLTFDWKAGGLWDDGPITIGFTVDPAPSRQEIRCTHP